MLDHDATAADRAQLSRLRYDRAMDNIQPSAEPGATRLAIAYDIVVRCAKATGDPTDVAALVGRTVRAMLEAEAGATGASGATAASDSRR